MTGYDIKEGSTYISSGIPMQANDLDQWHQIVSPDNTIDGYGWLQIEIIECVHSKKLSLLYIIKKSLYSPYGIILNRPRRVIIQRASLQKLFRIHSLFEINDLIKHQLEIFSKGE